MNPKLKTGVNHVKTSGNKKSVKIVKITPEQEYVNPNIGMIASDNGVKFTASFEAMGFVCLDGKVRAYQDGGCGKGNWTVGIGEAETGGGGINSNSVFESEQLAYESFKSRLQGGFSRKVVSNLGTAKVTRKLEQYEFDALVDNAYNHGNAERLSSKIAKGEKIISSHFQQDKELRRTEATKLFNGEVVSTLGYSRFMRLDNTNGGYCSIEVEGKKKDGYKVINGTGASVLTYPRDLTNLINKTLDNKASNSLSQFYLNPIGSVPLPLDKYLELTKNNYQCEEPQKRYNSLKL